MRQLGTADPYQLGAILKLVNDDLGVSKALTVEGFDARYNPRISGPAVKGEV
jgi:hypothetical protein